MSFEQFCNNSKTLDAVIRNFEIIGKAAKRLTDTCKEQHEAIEWYKYEVSATGLYTIISTLILKLCGR